VARYREKDETDLRWNRIRRRLTRELDTQIADWREDALNKLLSDAWEKYAEAFRPARSSSWRRITARGCAGAERGGYRCRR
jgi:hypothetical protein